MDTEKAFHYFANDIKDALDESIIIAITNNNGTIIYVNEAFCEVSKYSKDELLGKDHNILNSGYHPKGFFQDLWKTIGSGKTWTGAIKNKAKDGCMYWVQTTIVPQLDESGKPYCYVSIRTDITEHKLTEENLKNTLKSLSDITYALDESSIVAVTDPKGLITYVNETFCEISKYTREELIGKDHRILNSSFHPKAFFTDLWNTIRQGKVWKGEIKNKAKDGSYYWVYTTIVPLLSEEGEIEQFVSIRNDITSRKKTEEVLIRTEKLSVIGELAAGVAHEIRNPLTSLKGFAKLLRDEDLTNKDMYLDIILDEIERINHIVSDFMTLAKPFVVEFKEKKFLPLVMHVISLLESECHLNNIQVNLLYFEDFDHITVYCDEHQLKQVFLNLMKNAIEAMPLGGDIDVTLSTEKNEIKLEIKDNGIGMSAQMLERLGEPFYSTKEQGTGLGLMVSKNIIQNHNGTMRVDSEPGVGTKFVIFLPQHK